MCRLIAHRIALNPNKEQVQYFARAAGTARVAYNWALAQWKEQAQDWYFSDKLAPFPSDISEWIKARLEDLHHSSTDFLIRSPRGSRFLDLIDGRICYLYSFIFLSLFGLPITYLHGLDSLGAEAFMAWTAGLGVLLLSEYV
jgi:hypothetical protein